ncbi:MAG: DUF1566 domain-containing protein, partial [Nitrospirae bacterium]|nr:DUF1566 domain-containing protein [Nitrospirota bacterium]
MKASRFICLMILAVSLFIYPVIANAGGVISLPKTGQTTSYYAGDDGAIQAGVDSPAIRFADTGNGTIIDNLTGLEWLKVGNSGGAMLWKDALAYVDTLNSGTHSDWRMPNMYEMESLRNYGVANHASWLNTQGFQDIQTGAPYWVSTHYGADLQDPTSAWFVYMASAGRNYDGKNYNGLYYVLPVRGGQANSADPAYPANIPKTGDDACARLNALPYDWIVSDPCNDNYGDAPGQDGQLKMGVAWPTNGNSPDGRFTVGTGTMLDNLTGLMWTASLNTSNKLTWTGALDAIANYNATNYLGYNDWRLANMNEVQSLINYNVLWLDDGDPNYEGHWQYLINQGFTGDTYWNSFWTSTTNPSDTTKAYAINVDGREQSSLKASALNPWMAVRNATAKSRDDVIIDFGASGLWAFMNNLYNNTAWQQLNNLDPDSITTGDMDGDG